MNKLILNDNGMLLAEAKYDHISIINIWDPSNRELYIEIPEAHEGAIRTMSFIDNKYLLSGGEDNMVKLWDLGREGITRAWYVHSTDSINSVLGFEDYVFAASSDKTVRIWNQETGDLLTTFKDHTDEVYSLVVSREYLVSGSLDKTIKVRDLDKGELYLTLYGHTSAINNLVVKDNFLASTSWDNTVKLWDLTTGELVNTYGPMRDIPTALIFHPNSYQVFIAYDNGCNIVLWNPFKNEIPLMLSGHKSPISSMTITSVYSHEDKQLVSVSLDGDIKVWSIYTGISHD